MNASLRVESPAVGPLPRHPRRRLRAAGFIGLYLGVVIVLVGMLSREAWVIAAASALTAFSLLAIEVARSGLGGISPIAMYAFGGGLIGIANAVGFASAGGANEPRYFVYAVPEHFGLAAQLAFAGTLLPVLGFWLVSDNAMGRGPKAMLPRIAGHLRPRTLLLAGTALAIGSITSSVLGRVPSLGTVTALFIFAPNMVVFVIARYAARHEVRGAAWLALLLALAEATRAALFAYLRMELVLPLVSFTLGSVIGARSLRPLRSSIFVPIYLATALFFLYFGALGQARTMGTGLARFAQAQQVYASGGTSQTVLSRMTTLNQLSQVGRLVAERGHLGGETVSYLSYAFIPRFLWPDKPIIAKGAWFANAIGQARMTSSGRYNNAINMTVQGELYLNFGWVGVALGCIFLGAFLGALWRTVSFWGEPTPLGAAFGFYLLYVGFTFGADLQTGVTLLASYLVFLAGSTLLELMPGRRATRVDTSRRSFVQARASLRSGGTPT